MESLTSATTGGIGIRVLLNGSADGARLGFAWAGALDDAIVEATLAEARDNARFATRTPTSSSRPQTAWPPPSSICGTSRS